MVLYYINSDKKASRGRQVGLSEILPEVLVNCHVVDDQIDQIVTSIVDEVIGDRVAGKFAVKSLGETRLLIESSGDIVLLLKLRLPEIRSKALAMGLDAVIDIGIRR